jgi:hypothetical protein
VNDAAVRTRLVVFVSKVGLFLYADYRKDWRGEGKRGEECQPSDLLCWLTVIWSGAPTDSLWEVPTKHYLLQWDFWPRCVHPPFWLIGIHVYSVCGGGGLQTDKIPAAKPLYRSNLVR